MRSATSLEKSLAAFAPDRLSVDHRTGPPYDLPPEVDVERAIHGARPGGSVRVNGNVLSEDALRDPRTRVLFAYAPTEDFERTRIVDGVEYRERMGDVMGSMTGTANAPELTLRSVSPALRGPNEIELLELVRETIDFAISCVEVPTPVQTLIMGAPIVSSMAARLARTTSRT